nr:hypothetical protein [Paenibacillus alvei]
MLSEKYSSMTYFNAKPILQLNSVKDVSGYVLNITIIDANKAVNKLQIPTMAGRDSLELRRGYVSITPWSAVTIKLCCRITEGLYLLERSALYLRFH